GGGVMFKLFYRLLRPFRMRFHAAVIQVPHISQYLMSCRRAHCKIAVSDALNFSSDNKLTSYGHGERISTSDREFTHLHFPLYLTQSIKALCQWPLTTG